ncbi:hypothetical protein IQ64_25435 [Streptomyces stelliscabiei]|nr:hypothetical protein IQ61_28995 [Streptomyces scabiei]KND42108.1 hypothetical protein IQ64_25435 [Streptomyces stelliscabiei]
MVNALAQGQVASMRSRRRACFAMRARRRQRRKRLVPGSASTRSAWSRTARSLTQASRSAVRLAESIQPQFPSQDSGGRSIRPITLFVGHPVLSSLRCSRHRG